MKTNCGHRFKEDLRYQQKMKHKKDAISSWDFKPGGHHVEAFIICEGIVAIYEDHRLAV